MAQFIKSLRSLVDEREEVYFLALVTILTTAFLALGKLSGTEYIAGCATLYGLLLGGKAFAGHKEPGDG